MTAVDAALLQRVIRHQYWLTAEELAALLALDLPPTVAGGSRSWRGHRLEPVSWTPDGRSLWHVSPGAAMTTVGVRRFAGVAAREIPTWVPLVPGAEGVAELPPVLLRAVLGWISPLLPSWLMQFDWPANGSAAVHFAIGTAPALLAAGWAKRLVQGDAELAMAVALADGAGWQCAETGTVTVLQAGDLIMAPCLPAAVVTAEPAPLWLAGWAIRQTT